MTRILGRDRHRTEEGAAAELLLNSVTDIALILLDRDGLIRSWGRGADNVCGWKAEKVIGRHVSKLWRNEHMNGGEPFNQLATVLAAGRLEETRTLYRDDGSEFSASVILTPVFNETGHVDTYAAVIRDVSAQMAREQALKASEANLRSILDTVSDAMIVFDDQASIQFFSAAAEKQFGYSSSEAAGRHVSVLMTQPYREQHDGGDNCYQSVDDRQITGIGRVAVGQRKDGSTFPMELSIGEMQSGGKRFFTGFIRDLTERQKTEDRLQELQAELVHMSRFTALGEMASTLAHEINQPLTAITNYLRGCSRIIERMPDAAEFAPLNEAVSRAASQALRAGDVIRRLREFVARGETERRVENLPELIEEASALALLGARERGVIVEFDYDQAAATVVADRIQVQQVILNLIRNAIEAMGESGRRELSISTRRENASFVEIAVADTGPGIATEVAVRLFQPFVTTKSNGMGLGLSICRTIVESHGGRIWVEPIPGEGSRFVFSLKVTDVAEVADHA